MHDSTTAERKDAHLDLCANEAVEPAENATLLDDVKLIHCAMPELSLAEVDSSIRWMGKTLRFPIVMTGMTGGTTRAAQVNRDLAALAEEFGVAFGVGSQRAMLEQPELASTFAVRSWAPKTVIVGNLGLVQAVKLSADKVLQLMDSIDADGLAIHLNAGQELSQPEGDRDFRGGYATLSALAKVLGEKLLVKETGCGISPAVARQLVDCGVQNIDVSGLGGTSWVRVEQLRSSGDARAVGALFSSWGIPTAAAVLSIRRALRNPVCLIGSGGIRTGLDVAKVLVLGADLAGMALPLFRAHQRGGIDEARRELGIVIATLRQAMALTGSRNLSELRHQPRMVTGELKDWVAALDGTA